MTSVEDELVDFIENHFEQEFEQVKALKKELGNLRERIHKLEKKIDHVTDQTQNNQEEQDGQKERSSSKEETKSPSFAMRMLKSIKKRFDLPNTELAELLDVTPDTIAKWEEGISEPRDKDMAQISSIYDKTKEELRKMMDKRDQSVDLSPDDIYSIRKENELTRDEMGDRLGVSLNTVRNWENGDTHPDPAMVEKIKNIDTDARKHEEIETSGDDYTSEDVRKILEEDPR